MPRDKSSGEEDKFANWVEKIRNQYWRGELDPAKEALLDREMVCDFRLTVKDQETRVTLDNLRELIRKQNGNLGAEDEEKLADVKRNLTQGTGPTAQYKRKLLREVELFREQATAAGSKKIGDYFGAPTTRICDLSRDELVEVLKAAGVTVDDGGQPRDAYVPLVAQALECRRDTCLLALFGKASFAEFLTTLQTQGVDGF